MGQRYAFSPIFASSAAWARYLCSPSSELKNMTVHSWSRVGSLNWRRAMPRLAGQHPCRRTKHCRRIWERHLLRNRHSCIGQYRTELRTRSFHLLQNDDRLVNMVGTNESIDSYLINDLPHNGQLPTNAQGSVESPVGEAAVGRYCSASTPSHSICREASRYRFDGRSLCCNQS
jgi:hypothetical protein